MNAYICFIILFYLNVILILLYIIILQDLQENASASFEMANEVSTQQSNIQQTNMAMVYFFEFLLLMLVQLFLTDVTKYVVEYM